MMKSTEPNLKLAGLSLWVLGRQFPEAQDFWDGNWLNVQARVQAAGASVEARGAFVRTTEIAKFVEELEVLNANLVGEAALRCLEPTLRIVIRGDARGHATAQVMITPDHMTQSHEFRFDFDQTYFGLLLDGCRNVLSNWPIRSATSA
jgi:hypothetical protein